MRAMIVVGLVGLGGCNVDRRHEAPPAPEKTAEEQAEADKELRAKLRPFLFFPPEVGVLKLQRLKDSGYDKTAGYGPDWMESKAIELTCEETESDSLKCPPGRKRIAVAGAPACFHAVPLGDIVVRWKGGGLDCMLVAHPDSRSTQGQVIDAAGETLRYIAEHRKNADINVELFTRAIERGKSRR